MKLKISETSQQRHVIANEPIEGTERIDWVHKNFGPSGKRWHVIMNDYYFKYEEDAIQFALRWK